MVEIFDKLYGNKSYKKGGFRKRKKGTIITYAVVFSAVVWGIYALISKIGDADMGSFSQRINTSFEGFSDMLVLLQVRLAEMGILDDVDVYYREFLANITGYSWAYIGILFPFGKGYDFL